MALDQDVMMFAKLARDADPKLEMPFTLLDNLFQQILHPDASRTVAFASDPEHCPPLFQSPTAMAQTLDKIKDDNLSPRHYAGTIKSVIKALQKVK